MDTGELWLVFAIYVLWLAITFMITEMLFDSKKNTRHIGHFNLT